MYRFWSYKNKLYKKRLLTNFSRRRRVCVCINCFYLYVFLLFPSLKYYIIYYYSYKIHNEISITIYILIRLIVKSTRISVCYAQTSESSTIYIKNGQHLFLWQYLVDKRICSVVIYFVYTNSKHVRDVQNINIKSVFSCAELRNLIDLFYLLEFLEFSCIAPTKLCWSFF